MMKNNNLKETLSKLLPIVLLLAGITVLGEGISLLTSQAGMRKTDAVIAEITEEPYLINGREKQVVSALVTYTLEDTVYTADLGGVRSGFAEGDSLTVLVDPAAPQKVALPSAAAGVSCTVIGAALLILFPVLLQVASQVGVDPVQFGLIVVMNLVLGLCTPPVGVCLFAATAIGGNKLSENVKAMVPFMISNFTVLALVTYVPAISVGVANAIMGG